LLQIRLVQVAADPARSKEEPKLLRPDSRSSAAVRISGFRFGINPNPAVKICHFFLNTERTLTDILRTAKAAQAALENGT